MLLTHMWFNEILYQVGNKERELKRIREEGTREKRQGRFQVNRNGRINLEEWLGLAGWRKGENKVKMDTHCQFPQGQPVLLEMAQMQVTVSTYSHLYPCNLGSKHTWKNTAEGIIVSSLSFPKEGEMLSKGSSVALNDKIWPRDLPVKCRKQQSKYCE